MSEGDKHSIHSDSDHDGEINATETVETHAQ